MRWMIVLAVLLIISICTQCGTGSQVSPTPSPFPVAKDIGSLARSVPVIVVAKIGELQPGRTVGEGDARLTFNDVHVTVERRLKGQLPAELIVEQLTLAGRKASSEVGPAYEPGERYVLFLLPGEGNRYVTATQGRYLLRKGRVHPTEPGSVADKFREAEEAKVIADIEARLRTP